MVAQTKVDQLSTNAAISSRCFLTLLISLPFSFPVFSPDTWSLPISSPAPTDLPACSWYMDPLCLPEAVKQTRLSPPQIMAAISRSDADLRDKHSCILDTCMIRRYRYIYRCGRVYRQPSTAAVHEGAFQLSENKEENTFCLVLWTIHFWQNEE